MTGPIAKLLAVFTAFIIIAGATAYLTLTFIIKNEESVIVPDLTGKDIVSSLRIFSELGLNTRIRGSEYSDNIPLDHIIFQEPEPGTEIKKGRDIGIIVSDGFKKVTVPDIRNLSLAQARIILEQNGLPEGVLSCTAHTSIQKDHLIAQIPLPGKIVNHDQPVDLLISKGPAAKACLMPNLADLSLSDAIMLIESRNLRVGKIKEFHFENKPPDIVINQVPMYGYRVAQGTSVDIVLNRKTDSKKGRISANMPKIRFFRYRTQTGFLKPHVRVQLKSGLISEEPFNGYVQPGHDIWLFIRTHQDTIVLVYEDHELVKAESF
jgi:eukaryotic-like serine/threonine-protein kinase